MSALNAIAIAYRQDDDDEPTPDCQQFKVTASFCINAAPDVDGKMTSESVSTNNQSQDRPENSDSYRMTANAVNTAESSNNPSVTDTSQKIVRIPKLPSELRPTGFAQVHTRLSAPRTNHGTVFRKTPIGYSRSRSRSPRRKSSSYSRSPRRNSSRSRSRSPRRNSSRSRSRSPRRNSSRSRSRSPRRNSSRSRSCSPPQRPSSPHRNNKSIPTPSETITRALYLLDQAAKKHINDQYTIAKLIINALGINRSVKFNTTLADVVEIIHKNYRTVLCRHRTCWYKEICPFIHL